MMKLITLLLMTIFSFQNYFGQKNNLKAFQNQVNANLEEAYKNAYNDDFEAKYAVFYSHFKKGIESHPETFNYPFHFKNMFIETSKDKKLKVYSWMIQSEALARNYSTLFQFKSGNKIITTDEPYMAYICESIYEIPVKNKKYYILIGSTNEGANIQEETWCLEIVNNQLKERKIFRNHKEKTSAIIVNYFYDERNSDKTLIKFNPKTQ